MISRVECRFLTVRQTLKLTDRWSVSQPLLGPTAIPCSKHRFLFECVLVQQKRKLRKGEVLRKKQNDDPCSVKSFLRTKRMGLYVVQIGQQCLKRYDSGFAYAKEFCFLGWTPWRVRTKSCCWWKEAIIRKCVLWEVIFDWMAVWELLETRHFGVALTESLCDRRGSLVECPCDWRAALLLNDTLASALQLRKIAKNFTHIAK